MVDPLTSLTSPSDDAVDPPLGFGGDPEMLERLVALAHEHALRATRAQTELEGLRWQLQHDPESERLRLELAAVSAELERLRALPELRVGQRLRSLSAGSRRHNRSVTTTADSRSSTSAEGQVSEAHGQSRVASVITIRNRPRSLDLVLELLETHGIDEIEIVDNATSDPTLTNRLNSLSMPVRRLPTDLGAAAAWVSGAMAQRLLASDVLLIDASRPGATIPADTCPADVMARMSHELLRQPAVDAVELSPSSDEDRGRFRLVRIGLDRIPVTIAFLDPPYMSVTVVPDPTDPSERFARLHDELQLDVPPPL